MAGMDYEHHAMVSDLCPPMPREIFRLRWPREMRSRWWKMVFLQRPWSTDQTCRRMLILFDLSDLTHDVWISRSTDDQQMVNMVDNFS